MRYTANRPTLYVSAAMLQERKITAADVNRFIPNYVRYPVELEYGSVQRLQFLGVRAFLSALVWFILQPRVTRVGNLNQDEVNAVYDGEADGYDWKHHMTTRYQDTMWRRQAGWFIANLARSNANMRVLDLCTGTGLTAEAIQEVLTQWGASVTVTGLDFNQRMLKRAASRNLGGVEFVLGDATQLVKGQDFGDSPLVQFAANTFDAVTQMCGIGGIPRPLEQFEGVLRVLKPGGQFWMHDMHKPLPGLPGIVVLPKWLASPALESYVYEDVCLPLVLNRLWGWRDPTALFYLLTLVTTSDVDPTTQQARYFGFEVVNFMFEPQRWWFGIPYMPVAEITVKKVQIAKEEASLRSLIGQCCEVL